MNILITGGASGLGEAVVRKCAEKQHQVLFSYARSKQKAENLETQYVNVKSFFCDFRQETSVDALCSKISEMDIDVIINNAWTDLKVQHFHQIQAQTFLNTFQYNVLPTLKLTQSALSIFRNKKFGKIITILSAALVSNPPIGWADYVAAKQYLASMSKSWAVENAKFNITSNCISPAFMQTALTVDTDERIVENMSKQHPLKRLLTVEETAESVMYFLEASQQINATNLVINAAERII